MDLWVPSVQFVHVGVSATRLSAVIFLNACIVFVCQKKGEASTASSLLYVVVSIVFLFRFFVPRGEMILVPCP